MLVSLFLFHIQFSHMRAFPISLGKMREYIIPPETFFVASPEIRVRGGEREAELVQATLEQEAQVTNKGQAIDCFLRPGSELERDGHLARLEGVQRMDAFLRTVGNCAKLYHHGKVSRALICWNTAR